MYIGLRKKWEVKLKINSRQVHFLVYVVFFIFNISTLKRHCSFKNVSIMFTISPLDSTLRDNYVYL